MDCLVEMHSVNKEGEKEEILMSFPDDKFIWLGLRLLQAADAYDLKLIRSSLREELPVLPFAYEDECPCDQRRQIPFTMEVSAFFSE